MITHDATFESLAQAPVKQTDVVVVRQTIDPYGYYDDTPIWESSDYLMSVKIDVVGEFLGSATKKATVKLLGIIDTTEVGDLFQIRTGLYDSDPGELAFNYISQGFFLVDSIAYDYDSGSTTITMYDHMWLAAGTEYTSLIYPSTVEELAEQVATTLGVELMTGFDSLPNYDFSITEDLYATISGITMQSLIQEIAATTGTTARISDMTLTFSQFSVSDEDLTSNELRKLDISGQYGPVTSVVLGRLPQNDNIVELNDNSADNIISNVDDSTDLITITANEMGEGTLVHLESTGTLPSPLVANTNYFVYANGDPDTFSLTPTFIDAIAGTNLINMTDTGSGTITLTELEIHEVQINNVQILDNDREELLPPLYAALVGIEWHETKSDTVGLGWHEVGDVIQYTQGSTTVQSFISEIHMTFAGSIKEQLVAVIPDVATVDYKTVGGVLKTAWTTEIKVDKQENEIISLVEEVSTLGETVTSNYTEISQDVDDITATIQHTGGINLIKNSVGYALDADGDITSWDYTGTGAFTTSTSPESLNRGAVSGNQIGMTGVGTLAQNVVLQQGGEYTLAFRAKKDATGGVIVRLSNTTDDYTITLPTGTSYNTENIWEEQSLSVTATLGYFDVEIETTTPFGFAITDLRLIPGDSVLGWTQASGEVTNTQVVLNQEGIRVNSSIYEGDFTQITPLEFAGYSKVSGSQEKVFSLNRDTTEVTKLQADAQITMDPIKIVPITEGDNPGWYFVATVE